MPAWNCCSWCLPTRFTPVATEPEEEEGDSYASYEEPQPEKDIFSPLPDELVIKMLSYLGRSDLACCAALVNRRFCRLSGDPSLWTWLELPSYQRLDLNGVATLLRRCTMLRWFTPYSRTEEDIPLVIATSIFALTTCPRLKILFIDDALITLDFLKTIAEHGSSLCVLVLGNVRMAEESLLEANADCLKEITKLHLQGFSFEDAHLNAIGRHCKRLIAFTLFGTELSQEAVEGFLDAIKDSIMMLSYQPNITDAPAFSSIEQCRLLTLLELISAEVLSGPDLLSIASLPVLSSLNLRFASQWISKDYVAAFSDGKMALLTSLDLWMCSGLDDRALQEIAENCPNLEVLNLDFCKKVTNVGVSCILQNCCKMWEMRLGDLRRLTKASLDLIPTGMPKLRYLTVVMCWAVDDDFVRDIQVLMPSLSVTLGKARNVPKETRRSFSVPF